MEFDWLKDVDWRDLEIRKRSTDMFTHYDVVYPLLGTVGKMSVRHKREHKHNKWYTETYFGVKDEYQGLGLGAKILLAGANTLGRLSIVKGRVINKDVLKVLEKLKGNGDAVVTEDDWRYVVGVAGKPNQFEMHTTFEGFTNELIDIQDEQKYKKAIEIIRKHAETIGDDPDGKPAYAFIVHRNEVVLRTVNNPKYLMPSEETIKGELPEMKRWAKEIEHEIQMECGLEVSAGAYYRSDIKALGIVFKFDEYLPEGFTNSPDQKLGDFTNAIKSKLDDAISGESEVSIADTQSTVMADIDSDAGRITIVINTALKDFTGDSPSPQLVQVVGRMYDLNGEMFSTRTWDVDPSTIDGSLVQDWMNELGEGGTDDRVLAPEAPDAQEAGVESDTQEEEPVAVESLFGGGVDMAKLEEELDRLKKENPGKKVTYFFTKDEPSGYKFTIEEPKKKKNESNATWRGYTVTMDNGRKIVLESGIRGTARVTVTPHRGRTNMLMVDGREYEIMGVDEDFVTEKKGRASSWVIVYTPSKVILGKRSPEANNPNQWNFFGGGVEEGEDPKVSAARELQEEAGLSVDPSELRLLTTIGDATYYGLRVEDTSNMSTSDEISAIAKFKLTDMPNNLHSKTDRFFKSLDTLFEDKK